MGKQPRRKIKYIVFKVGSYFERYLLEKDQIKLIQTNAPSTLIPKNEPTQIPSIERSNQQANDPNQTIAFPHGIDLDQIWNNVDFS